MSGHAVVHWHPILSMSKEWELEFYSVVDEFNSFGPFIVATSSQLDAIDLHLVVYPASAHGEIVASSRMSTALSGYSGVAETRLAALACDRASPRVRDRHITGLLAAQADSHVAARHAVRALDLSSLRTHLYGLFELTLRDCNAWDAYRAARQQRTKLSDTPAEGENSWLRNQ